MRYKKKGMKVFGYHGGGGSHFKYKCPDVSDNSEAQLFNGLNQKSPFSTSCWPYKSLFLHLISITLQFFSKVSSFKLNDSRTEVTDQRPCFKS